MIHLAYSFDLSLHISKSQIHNMRLSPRSHPPLPQNIIPPLTQKHNWVALRPIHLKVLDPELQILKALSFSDVIDKENQIRLRVVTSVDRSELLLSSRVPHVQIEVQLAVQVELLREKVHSQSGHTGGRDLVSHEPLVEEGFSDSRIAN